MRKDALRILYREKRAALSHRDVNMLQDLILIRFQQLSIPFISVLHRFIAAEGKHEINPDPLADWLSFSNPGLLQVVPCIKAGTNELLHVEYNDETILALNNWGIPEPQNGQEVNADEIDMVLIPLLAFDQFGHRVGYGKGYYDRFLANCRPDCIKTGLSFFPAEDKITDTNTFDIAMDFCITPDKIYEF
jgi:5-formyltetrahydrofolate cyclo-ligase